jgi:hydrogenase maturation factor
MSEKGYSVQYAESASYPSAPPPLCGVPAADGSCITCSDMALPARVLRVDEASGTALVEVEHKAEEIDITLIELAAPGDVVLVHGGVAIALLGQAGDE